MTPRVRARSCAAIAAAAVCCGAGLAAFEAAPPPRPPSASRATAIAEAYNQREIGEPGWRRVHLELRSGAQVTRSFSILHLWRRAGDEMRSLVILEQPEGLRGTSYLLIEDPKALTGMRLFLRLPTGLRQVLTITPSRFDEGVLGSDFSYSDFRWHIPTAGYTLNLAGASRLLGRDVWMIDAVPANAQTSQSSSWSRVRYYVGREPVLLLGADFFHSTAAAPFKQLRVEALTRVGKAWTQTRMVMRLAGGRSSELTLRDQGPAPDAIDAGFFTPQTLPVVANDWGTWVARGLLRRQGP